MNEIESGRKLWTSVTCGYVFSDSLCGSSKHQTNPLNSYRNSYTKGSVNTIVFATTVIMEGIDGKYIKQNPQS